MADRRAGLATLVTLVVAVALAAGWLAAPPMGTDLSAQVARADFFAEHGWAPIDFRWYGGISPHGYSLVTPPLMAWLGPRPVGALAAVGSAVALVLLLLRTGARRPLLGGVLGAVCFTGNLVSGRITFAVGVALGLLALVAVSPGAPGRRSVVARRVVAGGLAALAAAASPVAGLFVGLAGVALLSLGWPARELAPRFFRLSRTQDPALPNQAREEARDTGAAVDGVVLAVGAAVPMAVMAGLFGAGGTMNISRDDLLHAVVTSLAVALLVPRRAVRVGALLSAAGVLAAYLLPTPVGLNATRLATMFALPVVAAYAVLPRLRPTVVWLVPVLALLAWWQPPVMDTDLATIDDPASAAEFFEPLDRELARRPPGRVEVVPTVNYWESAYVASAPLARGWLRQADRRWNPLFFDGTLTADTYRDWLVETGVSYVALSTGALSWVGSREAALIRDGLPYLTPVWRNDDWTLYEVTGATGLVEGPATLVSATAGGVVFDATGAGEVLVRVRWSRWLSVSGPAEATLAPAGDWTVVRVTEPGRYELTSG
ncbi:MAG TPA: hypothetical protein VIL37_04295 [Natronosporangium sp.]